MWHAVPCLYLDLGLTGVIYLLFRNAIKMHALSHSSRTAQPNSLLEAHLSHYKIHNCVLV